MASPWFTTTTFAGGAATAFDTPAPNRRTTTLGILPTGLDDSAEVGGRYFAIVAVPDLGAIDLCKGVVDLHREAKTQPDDLASLAGFRFVAGPDGGDRPGQGMSQEDAVFAAGFGQPPEA